MSGPGSLSPSSRTRSSTEEEVLPLSPHEHDSPFEVQALPDGVGLKPRLDSIFADVQASLPSIDFDVSDASSDEDVQILTRTVPKPKASKKHRILTTESWKDAVTRDEDIVVTAGATYEYLDPLSSSDKSVDGKDSGLSSSSNNERELKESVSHLDSVRNDSVDDLRFGEEEGTACHRVTSSADSLSSNSDDDTLEVIEEIIGFQNIPLNIEGVSSPSLLSRGESAEERHPSGVVTGQSKAEPRSERIKEHKANVPSEGSGFENFIPSGVPHLETGPIDHIDLDLLLDAFPERTRGPLRRGADPVDIITTDGAGDVNRNKDRECLKLMTQLAHLCVEQSGGAVKSEDVCQSLQGTDQPRHHSDRPQAKLAWQETSNTDRVCSPETAAKLSLNLSSLSEDGPASSSVDKTGGERKDSEGQRETIYLDLRKKEETTESCMEMVRPDAIKRILRLQSPSESSSSSEDESGDEGSLVTWHQQRRNEMRKAIEEAKGQTESQGVTHKDVWKENREHLPRPSKETAITDRNKLLSSVTPTLPDSVRNVPATPPQSPASGTPKRRRSGDASRQLDRQQHREMMKKLREEREAERQSRMRLQGQLNAMKPTMDTTGKQPAAQATPIVFDMDSSYSVSPEPLPGSLLPEDEVVLLTAHLGKLGELSTPRSSDSLRSASGTYSVLLSFLFSLVPSNLDFISDKTLQLASEGDYLDGVPFRVIGLQQVCHGGEISLHIAVVPKIAASSPFQKTRPKRSKHDKRTSTPFQSILTKFFATSTLHALCPWLDTLTYSTISNEGMVISSPPGARYESCLEDGTYLPRTPQPTTRPLSTFLSVSPDPGAARRMLAIPVSFFWQTKNTDEHLLVDFPSGVMESVVDVQNTMCLIYDVLFRESSSMMGIFHRIYQEGLGVAGLRLLYIDQRILSNPSAIHPQRQSASATDSGFDTPVLALALRGSNARSTWLDIVGPSDPALARRTDPTSLMANYGGSSRDELVIYSPRNPSRINYDLSFWFGGRVPPDGVVDLRSMENSGGKGTENTRKKRGKKNNKADAQREDGLDEFPVVRTHVSTLIASTVGDIFLTVAPVVPPMCLGMILSICHRRGFLTCGVRRMRLNSKRATSLGLTGPQVRIFSPVSCTTPTSPKNYEEELKTSIRSGLPTTTRSTMPSTILLLRMENALHHSRSLQETLMVTLSHKGILSAIKEDCGAQMTSDLCFHVTPYSDNLLGSLGGDFNKVPSYERFASSSVPPSFYSNPELEQIVAIAFTGCETLKNVGDSLGVLLGMTLTPTDAVQSSPQERRGLELLGLKFIPSLSMAQSKELTPYEVGSSEWQASIQFFSSQPSLICILRGIDAFQRVHTMLKTPITPRSRRQLQEEALKVVMSSSPEIAYRQAAHFFRDHELFADPSMRENLRYFPPLRSPSLEELSTARFSWAEEPPPSPSGRDKAKGTSQKKSKGMLIVEESIFKTMLTGPRLLTTVLVIKPFAVQKYLSKILKRVLQEDFTVVAMTMLMLSPHQAALLVPSEFRTNRVVSSMHVDHLMSGPSLALCLLRENAVKKLLDLLGPENPLEAKQKNQFFWRGLYGADLVNNALYGSESYSDAITEIKALFPDGLCHQETPDLKADHVMSPGVDQTLGLEDGLGRHFYLRLPETGGLLSSSCSSNDLDAASISLESLTSASPGMSSADIATSPLSSMGVSASPSEISLPSHSALCQTNCLLLTPILQLLDVRSHRKGYVEVIDTLISHGFEIVALRMFWLTKTQAEEFLMIYHSSSQNLSKVLCHGPCIALAVQRDNAVNCFETSLGSTVENDSIITKYGSNILRPRDTDGAKRYLTFFFDELMPQSQGYILREAASPRN